MIACSSSFSGERSSKDIQQGPVSCKRRPTELALDMIKTVAKAGRVVAQQSIYLDEETGMMDRLRR